MKERDSLTCCSLDTTCSGETERNSPILTDCESFYRILLSASCLLSRCSYLPLYVVRSNYPSSPYYPPMPNDDAGSPMMLKCNVECLFHHEGYSPSTDERPLMCMARAGKYMGFHSPGLRTPAAWLGAAAETETPDWPKLLVFMHFHLAVCRLLVPCKVLA